MEALGFCSLLGSVSAGEAANIPLDDVELDVLLSSGRCIEGCRLHKAIESRRVWSGLVVELGGGRQSGRMSDAHDREICELVRELVV